MYLAKVHGESGGERATLTAGFGGGGFGHGAGSAPTAPAPGSSYAFEEESVEGQLLAARAQSRPSRGVDTEPAQITIRTELPATTFWDPSLVAERGSASMSARLPDAITRQQLTVVASDAQGGVGIGRVSVVVDQPLVVRADLPAELEDGVATEVQVMVTNRSDEALDVEVALVSDNLEVTPLEDGVLRVETGDNARRRFRVRALRPGPVSFEASAIADEVGDVFRGEIFSAPTGEPIRVTHEGTTRAAEDWSAEIVLPASRSWASATLSVRFPAVTSAYGQVDELLARVHSEELDATVSDLVSLILLYEARRDAATMGDAALQTWSEAITDALERICAAQRPDGGWGFSWDGSSTPYITGWVLEALNAAQRADFSVPERVGVRAVERLLSAIDQDALDVEAISFWEGEQPAMRAGLRAELLDVLARAPERFFEGDAAERLGEAITAEQPYFDEIAPDVLRLAHLVGATSAARDRALITVEEDQLRGAARRLAALRSQGHWEPSWFHAYGGTIEATVITLEVLRHYDPEGFELVKRDALRYLLSTAEAWGDWHNARGTAWAIRGLLGAGAGAEEVASTVSVVVEGETVSSVVIDPEDPFLSSAPLWAFDLTPSLVDGAQQVELRYDGALEPWVRIDVQHWE